MCRLYLDYGAGLNNIYFILFIYLFIDTPTRNNNILDLVLSTSTSITDLSTAPAGMSDHEAIVFYYNIDNAKFNTKPKHKVALYHQANLDTIKRDLLEFQTCFLTNDPYSKTVEQNWIDLKDAMDTSVVKHVPFKTICSYSRLPWINAEIKKDMKKRKHLYSIAKRTKSEDDWKV